MALPTWLNDILVGGLPKALESGGTVNTGVGGNQPNPNTGVEQTKPVNTAQTESFNLNKSVVGVPLWVWGAGVLGLIGLALLARRG